ncbi:hypothetical protein OBBRIDRAFT_788416 [Obba rivulosa]|uniref:Uncharacterized protein n=1 Tax=Obba rivulosa TaxID=1052685 RepID=A0A8E2DSW9_9APHY|nr:hypothetical protein OBBRIDRAFT_788416 [Obba rivulosa]
MLVILASPFHFPPGARAKPARHTNMRFPCSALPAPTLSLAASRPAVPQPGRACRAIRQSCWQMAIASGICHLYFARLFAKHL